MQVLGFDTDSELNNISSIQGLSVSCWALLQATVNVLLQNDAYRLDIAYYGLYIINL